MDFVQAFHTALGKGWIVFRNTLSSIAASLPHLIGGLTILAVGVIAAKALRKLLVRILVVLGIDKITEESGADITLKKMGYRGRTLDLIGDLVKWFIYLIALTATVDALGLTVVSAYFTQVANFVPKIIFSIILLITGLMIADFIGSLVRNFLTMNVNKKREKSRVTMAKMSETCLRISIYIVAIILSLNVLGLSTEALNILFGVVSLGFLVVVLVGSKDIVPNFVAGVHLQSKISVGDKLTLEHSDRTYSGTVEKIGKITTTLADKKDLTEVPNLILLNSIRKRKPKI